MRRVHHMPFGAQCAPQGVSFRLWAPAAGQVDLIIEGAAWKLNRRERAMERGANGFFECFDASAIHGDRYRFRIDGELLIPDPASRSNPDDVSGASAVVDPATFEWHDADWAGIPWREAVIYELHIGTFTPAGTYRAVIDKLGHLKDLGITLIELMPVADFPGRHGWGYDGVLPFAPDSSYGTPDDLKALIAAAHQRGMGVLLDVVYNHFGPEGNYLHAYAPQFFTERHSTPWGAGINLDGEQSRTVRDFIIHNALYWLEEYHLDGLRLDAVHALRDDSAVHLVVELAHAVRAGPGRSRPVHLVLENNANEAHFLGRPGQPGRADAQWNDDVHHCLHVLLTGESDGYYGDYAAHAATRLARALAEGFVYQGEYSVHEARNRGEPSAALPPSAFINFLQNHDQIGNRAFGERLAALVPDEAALRAATAVLLLSPAIPLLFMGEEWGAPEPFVYFCDFAAPLADQVREGRRREFERFEKFRERAAELPDPVDRRTFESSRLDWDRLDREPHARWLQFHRDLLAIRRREIVPLIDRIRGSSHTLPHDGGFRVDWLLDDGHRLRLLANLSGQPATLNAPDDARVLYSTAASGDAPATASGWDVLWLLLDT